MQTFAPNYTTRGCKCFGGKVAGEYGLGDRYLIKYLADWDECRHGEKELCESLTNRTSCLMMGSYVSQSDGSPSKAVCGWFDPDECERDELLYVDKSTSVWLERRSYTFGCADSDACLQVGGKWCNTCSDEENMLAKGGAGALFPPNRVSGSDRTGFYAGKCHPASGCQEVQEKMTSGEVMSGKGKVIDFKSNGEGNDEDPGFIDCMSECQNRFDACSCNLEPPYNSYSCFSLQGRISASLSTNLRLSTILKALFACLAYRTSYC